jgi:hypothetical protein
MLMNEKGNAVVEFGDGKWLQDLALLYDISHHLYDLNSKFQDQ